MSRQSDKNIQVFVPPTPEFVYVIRGVVGGVAASTSLPMDAVDDLRLAVDEACNAMILLPGEPSRLRVDIELRDAELLVRVCLEAGTTRWPPEGFRASLPWTVITGLTDDAKIVEDGAAVIEIRKRLTDPAR